MLVVPGCQTASRTKSWCLASSYLKDAIIIKSFFKNEILAYVSSMFVEASLISKTFNDEDSLHTENMAS